MGCLRGGDLRLFSDILIPAINFPPSVIPFPFPTLVGTRQVCPGHSLEGAYSREDGEESLCRTRCVGIDQALNFMILVFLCLEGFCCIFAFCVGDEGSVYGRRFYLSSK